MKHGSSGVSTAVYGQICSLEDRRYPRRSWFPGFLFFSRNKSRQTGERESTPKPGNLTRGNKQVPSAFISQEISANNWTAYIYIYLGK